MDRFTPDVFLEWLLRPLLMADPSAFMYVEFMAPDLRPAFLITMLFIGAVFGSLRARMTAESWRLLVAFWLTLYLWTFVIGNGRYFLSALLLLGPLLMLAWQGLPGTKPFRWMTLALIGGLQAAALANAYKEDVWARSEWVNGPGIDIEESELRHRPAVFIMASVNAYSVLVPRFHPDSRWAQLIGQRDLSPAVREYALVVELLASALPKLLVIPIPGGWSDKVNQPDVELRKFLDLSLIKYGLALNGQPCGVLRSTLPRVSGGMATTSKAGEVPKEPERGFWFCPMNYADADRIAALAKPPAASQLSDVFNAIEQRCPRFFPPGSGVTREFEGLASRWYPSIDMLISVRGDGDVTYKYFRALNHLSIGNVAAIRAGKFAIQCDKPPGRYRMPWSGE
jgi:hypothetical protein